MRIAIIGANNSFDSLEFHLKDELSIQGNHVEIFDYEKLPVSRLDFGIRQFSMKYDLYRNNQILNKIINFTPDLVIGVYRHIHPNIVRDIKNHKIKIIHINPDQLTTLQNQQIFVEEYDHYFTKDSYMARFMRDKIGLKVSLYNEAFNPRYHNYDDVDDLKHEINTNIDVLSFGNLYPYRNKMLKHLIENKINLNVFGHRAKFLPKYIEEVYKNKGIYGEEKSKLLLGSKIVFNNFHYAEIESVNNKFFEINGIGAFQLCDYKPILNDLLPIDPKLVSYKSMDEATKLINYYIDKPEKRFEIRRIIKSHFVENYTYTQLVTNVMNSI